MLPKAVRKRSKDSCHYCKRPYTQEEKAVRAQAAKDRANKARDKCLSHGGKLGRKSLEIKDHVLTLRRHGATIRKIAKLLGCAPSTVMNIVKKYPFS